MRRLLASLAAAAAAIAFAGPAAALPPAVAIPFVSATVTPFTTPQTLNMNAADPLAGASNAIFNMEGADAAAVTLQISAAANPSALIVSRFDGTGAAPTAVQATEDLGGVRWFGWGSSAWEGPIAALHVYADENLDSGHHGSQMCLAVTPNASGTLADKVCLHNNGAITVNTTDIFSGSPLTGHALGTMLNIGGPVTVDRALNSISEGVYLRTGSGTLTNTCSVCVPNAEINGTWAPVSFNATTMASNVPVIYQRAATLYIGNPPLSGSNVSVDLGSYSIYVAGGKMFLGSKASNNGQGGLIISDPQTLPNWGVTGAYLAVTGTTLTDSTLYNTAGNNPASSVVGVSFSAPTIAFNNCVSPCTGVTYTTASTVYIQGAPIVDATSLPTITNQYALNVNSGIARFGGGVKLSGGQTYVPSTSGALMQVAATTLTDATSAAGTVALTLANSMAVTTFATAGNAVTYSDAAGLYLAGNPAAGANVTITRSWASYNLGDGYIAGVLSIGTKTKQASGINSVAYWSSGNQGVTCSGTPTSSFASTNGIVTHC